MTPDQHLTHLLDHLIEHLETVLPGQAPIRQFVHHNTLHGFQHLPFPEAMAASRRVTGIYGYPSRQRFRALYHAGRITRAELETELLAAPDLEATHILLTTPQGPVRALDVYRVALVHDLSPQQPHQVRWQMEERQCHTRFPDDLPAEARERLLPPVTSASDTDEAAVVQSLWQACQAWSHHPALRPASESTFPASPDAPTLNQISRQISREAEHLLEQTLHRIGSEQTLRQWLLGLTGYDLLKEFQPLLVRQLASFLDHGFAAWNLPDRQAGFFAAWRTSALTDLAFLPEQDLAWRSIIADLGDDATRVIADLLTRLGLPATEWSHYLERLALELPGWSGMVLWHHHHPDETRPQMMMQDYLAVRLLLEHLYATRLCRRLWQVAPSLTALSDHFRHNRAEFLVRWALFNARANGIPEHLTTQAERLLRHSHQHVTSDAQWLDLARDIVDHLHARTDTAPELLHGRGWTLFRLASCLGLSGSLLQHCTPEQISALYHTIDRLDEERAGYLWLQAYERHYRDQIFQALLANHGRGVWAQREQRPEHQVVFCMDDREESLRRHLEELVPATETLGGAGFFGVPIYWRGLEDTGYTPLCPVVVTPQHRLDEIPCPDTRHQHQQRQRWRTRRQRLLSWAHHGTRIGLLTPLAMTVLSAPVALALLAGKVLLPRHTGQWLERWRTRLEPELPTDITLTRASNTEPLGLTDAEQADMVARFLRAIGLTHGFAPLVLFVGHGSGSQNNPHRAAYDCGACSGRHGGPNGRVFAAMANRPEVRALLRQQQIVIPEESWFLAAEHNTCDDRMLWYDLDRIPSPWREPTRQLQQQLDQACTASAHERVRRLASAPRRATSPHVPRPDALHTARNHVHERIHDFSQARPELGHATNAVAVVGRRSMTRGIFFDRRMYLVSYDPLYDPSGSIVEQILLAVGPVGAGIALEYYFSTVNNDQYGCGSKITHNVVGLFGVMDGTSSDLRTGLPRQMIEIHEAMRLLVIVEQETAVLDAILERQPILDELVGNGWIHLAAKPPTQCVLYWYRPGGSRQVAGHRPGHWEPWHTGSSGIPDETTLPTVASSADWYTGHTGPLPPARVDPPKRPLAPSATGPGG